MATKEASVLGAVCKNKDIHLIIAESEELFSNYADVFKFMRDHYLQYKSVPAKNIIEDRFPEVELPETTSPSDYYIAELKNDFVKNKMGGIITEAAEKIDGGMAPARILDGLQTRLAKLGRYTASARDLDITDADSAEEYFKKVRLAAEENGGIHGIATGFKSIDSVYTTGMAGGHFIVPMGYTGRGKSMWADLLAVNAWAQGKKPMIISLEMSPEEQRERLYAMMSHGRFKISDLSRGDVSMDDFGQFRKKTLDGANQFVVVSAEGMTEVTPNTIQAKIDMHKPDLVILDYLQLMKDNAKTQAMTPRMLNLSRECKMLAMTNSIPIVGITAVTDEDGDKRDSPPVLSQIAWSSGIEFDANLAIAIHRREGSNIVEIVCRKNRHGELFSFYFEVDFDRGIWKELFHLNAQNN